MNPPRRKLQEEVAARWKNKRRKKEKNVFLEMAKHAYNPGRKVTWAADIDKILYGAK